MKIIFECPGFSFIKDTYQSGGIPQPDYRILLPKKVEVVDYDNEIPLTESNAYHMVFEFNRKKNVYQFKYII